MNGETQQARTRDTHRFVLGERERGIVRQLSQGDIGSIPVLIGLVIIALIFQFANHNFLASLNLTNLMVQISQIPDAGPRSYRLGYCGRRGNRLIARLVDCQAPRAIFCRYVRVFALNLLAGQRRRARAEMQPQSVAVLMGASC